METYTEPQKNRIIAILGGNRRLLSLSFAKIYTSGKDGPWLYSDLEGFLCLIHNEKENIFYFYLYDSFNYDRLFTYEIYQNFDKYYHVLSNDFHCFETNQGFIGVNFESAKEADKMYSLITVLSSPSKLALLALPKKKAENLAQLISQLKKKFSSIQTTSNLKPNYFTDDGLDICKPLHFSLLMNIKYDSARKRFIANEIPKDLKNILKGAGIKKYFLNDTVFALQIFKIIIQDFEEFQNRIRENALNIKKSNDGKNLTMKEKILYSKQIQKKASQQKITDFDTKQDSKKNILQKANPTPSSTTTVPAVPAVPAVPKVPQAPKLPTLNAPVVTPPQQTSDTSNPKKEIEVKKSVPINNDVSLKTQIEAVKLKKVEERPIKLQEDNKKFLQTSDLLQMAIKQRREKLISTEEVDNSEDDDWSDDD